MSKYNILIVDDEPNVCNFLTEFLDFKGFTSRSTLSGKEALSVLNSEHFDLVLLDLIMPEMNGFETLERIRKDQPKLPIIILTGVKDKNVANDSMEMGAVDFIPKPIDLERLENSILINVQNIG